MTRTVSLVAVVALGWFGASAGAQSRPDFSGRWTSAPEPAAVAPAAAGARGAAPGGRRGGGGAGRGGQPGDMGSGWGDPITVTQDGRLLTVEYAFFSRGDLQPPLRFTYALDGTPINNTVTLGRGLQEQRSRTAWEGATLVITSVYTFAHPATGEPVSGTMRRTLTLASPTSLVVEVLRDGVLGGPASTTRTVFRKLS
jgi:hypothetical protein